MTFIPSLIALIAVPDVIPFGACAVMPDLVPIKRAAFPANDLIAQGAAVTDFLAVGASLCQFLLYPAKNLRVNDWVMGALYEVLPHFPIVFAFFFREVVDSVGWTYVNTLDTKS